MSEKRKSSIGAPYRVVKKLHKLKEKPYEPLWAVIERLADKEGIE